MSQSAKAPEPSIDDILASIRRSIVPDDPAKPVARRSASRKPAAAMAAAVPAPANAKVRSADGEAPRAGAAGGLWSDTSNAAGDPAEGPIDSQQVEARIESRSPVTERGDATEEKALRVPSPDDGLLLSPHTTAAVDTAFNSLARTVVSQSPRTLEDLVREMLKPMLKEWLDANLPDMVERLVRAEIERVSRRG